jgi:hypothetical protein
MHVQYSQAAGSQHTPSPARHSFHCLLNVGRGQLCNSTHGVISLSTHGVTFCLVLLQQQGKLLQLLHIIGCFIALYVRDKVTKQFSSSKKTSH